MEPKKRGRPKGTTNPDRAHKRTVAFPPDLYARLSEIADAEERDVTSQIVKVLRDFIARYEKGEEPGPFVPADLEPLEQAACA